jgi:hypothetical protein
MSEIIKSVAFILASIILARFALPANITPIIAMPVFLPYITKNKHLQTLLPIGILFLTDIFLGFYGATMLFVYGTLLLISLLSRKSYDGQFKGILKTSGFSVLLWHIIVNFGVYLNGLGTISLAQTYLAAIPFDFRLLVSTLAFSSLFYGCNFAVSCYINKESFSSKPTPLA